MNDNLSVIKSEDGVSKATKSIALCSGCRNDFYNGHNPYGVKQCWSFPSAVLEKRIKVGVWERPPYSAKRATWCLNCHKPDGYVQVKPESLDSKGFWKS